ncbi:MAG: hypothetical protein KIT78_05805 [Steroidobacteraceae bacterium]|nr:hypothetical protein [Steroidobacteraceae bacterium]
MNRIGKRGLPLVIAAAWMCTGIAMAQQVDLGLTIGAFHTDNIRRESTDEESQTVGELGLRLGWTRNAGRLNGNVDANLAYREYFDDAYDSDLQGGFNGRLVYWFLPERLSWEFQDNYARALIDPRNVDTPGNQQNANYFTTGPDLRLAIGDRTSVLIGGRWSDAYYEDTDAGNQRLSGSLGIERRMSERSTLSLNATAERVEYDDDTLASDFDRQSGYLEFANQGARTRLSVRAGGTVLHDFGDTTSGPLLNLTMERQLSARSTLTLNAGTELTDSADAMRREQQIGGVDIEGDHPIISAGQFQSDFVSLAWALEGARTTLDLAVDLRSEDYEGDATLNRDALGATAAWVRRLSARLSWRVFGGWTTQDFDRSDVKFDEWNAGTGFDWLLTETVGVTLLGERFEGSGDTLGGANQRDYTENRVTVRLTYTPRRR